MEFLGSNLMYIDPAATSALLSSITAILVALGASFIVLWRKFKKKVDKTFKIDPNKNKEVEADLVVNDEELADKTTTNETAANNAQQATTNAAAETAPAEVKSTQTKTKKNKEDK